VNATTLCTLLRELNALKGDFWIRLLYTHPAHWTDGLIRTIAECPKVTRYAQTWDGKMPFAVALTGNPFVGNVGSASCHYHRKNRLARPVETRVGGSTKD
jgi:hypothetical protein